MERPGYVFGFLRRRLDDATVDQVCRMRLTKDQQGAVFDVPAALADDFVAQYVRICKVQNCVWCSWLVILLQSVSSPQDAPRSAGS
jgi:hypothetical protein